MSTLLPFYFESDPKRETAAETPGTPDLETVFKRQRAVQGICGKTQPIFSEQWFQQMASSTEEKVRTLQKTKLNSQDANHFSKVPASDWLDSPKATAEAQLRRFDTKHPQARELPAKPKNAETLIWKAPLSIDSPF